MSAGFPYRILNSSKFLRLSICEKIVDFFVWLVGYSVAWQHLLQATTAVVTTDMETQTTTTHSKPALGVGTAPGTACDIKHEAMRAAFQEATALYLQAHLVRKSAEEAELESMSFHALSVLSDTDWSHQASLYTKTFCRHAAHWIMWCCLMANRTCGGDRPATILAVGGVYVQRLIKWMQHAVKSGLDGDCPLMYCCGQAHEKILRHQAKSAVWFQRAADQGYAPAQHALALRFHHGKGVVKNGMKAVQWYRRAAEQGFADAQHDLAECYRMGDIVPQNFKEAVAWYRRAVDQNHAEAQHSLGVCYYYGQGVPYNREESAKWYRRSAEQGLIKAQCNLGLSYCDADGVPQDYEQAVKWFRLAAEQDDEDAQYLLATHLYDGRGVAQDYKEAAMWFQRAAAAGHIEAQHGIGKCYRQGEGVPQDHAKAAWWFQKSAEQGFTSAQKMLSVCYKTGQGVPRNPEKARMWHSRFVASQKADLCAYIISRIGGAAEAPIDDASLKDLFRGLQS